MFDVDKFIVFVQQNPAIWDRRTHDYSDRMLRERSWNAVGESMMDTWEEMTEEERQEQVKEMKKKWRHIRDGYLKFINQDKCGEPAAKKKRYVYAPVLTFLRQTFTRKRTRKPPEKVDNVENGSRKKEKEAVPAANTSGIRIAPPQQLTVTGTEAVSSPVKKSNPRKSAVSTPIQSKLIEKQPKKAKSDQEDDADKSFLLSLLPYMKKLNDEQKLDFRLHSLQFFRDLRRETTSQSLTQLTPSFQHFQNCNSEFQEHSGIYTPTNNPLEQPFCSIPTSILPDISPTPSSTSPTSVDLNDIDNCKVKIEVTDFNSCL